VGRLPMVGHRYRTEGDLWGVIWLELDHCQPLDCMEVTVSADERCVDGKCGRSNPEVVLIERKPAALLRSLHICIPITGCRWDRLTRQNGEQTRRFPFQFASAPPRSQSLQTEQDFAASDCTAHDTVIRPDR